MQSNGNYHSWSTSSLKTIYCVTLWVQRIIVAVWWNSWTFISVDSPASRFSIQKFAKTHFANSALFFFTFSSVQCDSRLQFMSLNFCEIEADVENHVIDQPSMRSFKFPLNDTFWGSFFIETCDCTWPRLKDGEKWAVNVSIKKQRGACRNINWVFICTISAATSALSCKHDLICFDLTMNPYVQLLHPLISHRKCNCIHLMRQAAETWRTRKQETRIWLNFEC